MVRNGLYKEDLSLSMKVSYLFGIFDGTDS